MMKKWVSALVPFVGLAIFIWIVSGTGVHRILETFRGIDPRRLLVFPVLMVFLLWLRGYRWWLLIRVVGIDYSMWRSTVVYSIGFFAASITPGKVGDAVRALYLSRETGRGFGECFLTVFVDRLMDLVAMLVLGLAALLVFSYRYIDIPSLWIIVAASVALMAMVYVMLHRDVMKKVVGPVFRVLTPVKYREQLSAEVHGFYDGLTLYGKHWKTTVFAVLLMLLFWGTAFVLAYSVTWVLGIDVPFAFVVLMMPMVTLVEIIPISISGLGTREAAVIFFFSVLGIASAEAVGFSITYLLAGTYLTALVGFVAWLANPAKLRA